MAPSRGTRSCRADFDVTNQNDLVFGYSRQMKTKNRKVPRLVLCELGSGPNLSGKFARLPFEA